MTYLILGGSTGLGRALAEKYASAGQELIIISQDIRDTQALASHLVLSFGVKVTPLVFDMAVSLLQYELIDDALKCHGPLKGIIVPAGAVAKDDAIGMMDEKLERLNRINYLSPIKLINHYLPALEKNEGIIIGFGSVAAVRGRSRNVVYAAAKRALESYFESLRHYSVGRRIYVQFYVLGYLNTNLAFAQKLLFPRGNPQVLAKLVFERQKKEGTIFFPRYWYFIYQAVKTLPWNIFKRLKF